MITPRPMLMCGKDVYKRQVQAFLGADVDMNRANEVRPIFRSLGDIAQATGCAIVLIGHLNKAAGTQSTYRGLGSIDITACLLYTSLSSLRVACPCFVRFAENFFSGKILLRRSKYY